MQEYRKLITIDPLIANGEPCLRGTPPGPAVLISDIVEMVNSGVTLDQILAQHPHLKLEDLRACLAHLASEPTTNYRI